MRKSVKNLGFLNKNFENFDNSETYFILTVAFKYFKRYWLGPTGNWIRVASFFLVLYAWSLWEMRVGKRGETMRGKGGKRGEYSSC